MARLSIWNNGIKGNDYKFVDKSISEYFSISGTALYVHMYEGVYDQTDGANGAVMANGISSIQDPLLLENRDRKYSDTVYELRGLYNVTDLDFDLRQFGLFLQNDTIFIEVHLNDMIAALGRRIISGDVIELPHLRDDTAPSDAPAINKFYEVKDASKAAEGYSTTWYPHIWRIKCEPMTAGQEFADILDKTAKDPFGLDQDFTLKDILSTEKNELAINNQVVENAKLSILNKNFETQQFWILPGTETDNQLPWIFAGDGIPPNGAETIGSGTSYPINANVGDYFLRTDYSPATLFRRVQNGWKYQESNYRTEWSPAHRVLEDFLNNKKENTFKDGAVIKERQSLSKVVQKPRSDF